MPTSLDSAGRSGGQKSQMQLTGILSGGYQQFDALQLETLNKTNEIPIKKPL